MESKNFKTQNQMGYVKKISPKKINNLIFGQSFYSILIDKIKFTLKRNYIYTNFKNESDLFKYMNIKPCVINNKEFSIYHINYTSFQKLLKTEKVKRKRKLLKYLKGLHIKIHPVWLIIEINDLLNITILNYEKILKLIFKALIEFKIVDPKKIDLKEINKSNKSLPKIISLSRIDIAIDIHRKKGIEMLSQVNVLFTKGFKKMWKKYIGLHSTRIFTDIICHEKKLKVPLRIHGITTKRNHYVNVEKKIRKKLNITDRKLKDSNLKGTTLYLYGLTKKKKGKRNKSFEISFYDKLKNENLIRKGLKKSNYPIRLEIKLYKEILKVSPKNDNPINILSILNCKSEIELLDLLKPRIINRINERKKHLKVYYCGFFINTSFNKTDFNKVYSRKNYFFYKKNNPLVIKIMRKFGFKNSKYLTIK